MNRSIVLVIVALLVIACCVLALAGGVALVALGTVVGLAPGEAEVTSLSEELTRTFDVGMPARLVVNQTNGRVQVRTGGEGSIAVRAIKRASGPNAADILRRLEVDTRQDGDTVRVATRESGTFVPLGGRSVDYEIVVPAETRIEVKSDNGAISIEGVTGDVVVQTDNGRIDVVSVEGRIDAESDNGAIGIRDARAPQLHAQTDNGGVEFQGSLGAAGSSQVETNNGSVRMTLARTDRLRIEARSANGSIRNDLPLTDEVKTQRSLTGILNAPDATLAIQTDNGSITLDAR